MGSEDHSGVERRLQFERETLRDLAPSLAEAATVRGGEQQSMTGTRPSCAPAILQAAVAMLGQTALTYGFTGTMKVSPLEEGQEYSFTFEPTPEARDMHADVVKRFGG